ncbi:MAG: hypothetical protein JXA96_08390 [Sedimentisphaerales bacterium]|nr:hypothetical protein [Sedimentisphaerales bacterium]
MLKELHNERYVLCLDNNNYPASLEVRKIYLCVSDPDSESHGMIRVIDESGEDYLYPASLFVPIAPSKLQKHLPTRHNRKNMINLSL